MADGDRTDNISIANSDNTKIVSIITDGAVERLAVDASVTVSPVKYRIQTEFSDTDVTFIDDTWTTVVDITDEGKPYLLLLEFFDSNFDVRITVDAVVVFEMTNQEMGQVNLNQANALKFSRGGPYRYTTDALVWHFPDSVTFDTSFKVEVRRRAGANHGLDNYFFEWGKVYV